MTVSREEFERLYTTMEAGFRGMNDRLDRLNGSVARHEVRIAEEAQKTKSLEKEVFHAPPAAPVIDAVGVRAQLSAKQTLTMLVGAGTIWIGFRLMELLGSTIIEHVWKALSTVQG